MTNEIMDGLARELDAVVALLSALEAARPVGVGNAVVDRLRFDAQRLTRRFRLLGIQPAGPTRASATVDFGTLLCLAIRPAGRECKRRQCFLRLDLGRGRGLGAVAGQTLDAVLSVVEDAVHYGATWVEVAVETCATGMDVTVRTDADLTVRSLGVMLIGEAAASLGAALQLQSMTLETGVVSVRLHAQAVWIGTRRQPVQEGDPGLVNAPTGT